MCPMYIRIIQHPIERNSIKGNCRVSVVAIRGVGVHTTYIYTFHIYDLPRVCLYINVYKYTYIHIERNRENEKHLERQAFLSSIDGWNNRASITTRTSGKLYLVSGNYRGCLNPPQESTHTVVQSCTLRRARAIHSSFYLNIYTHNYLSFSISFFNSFNSTFYHLYIPKHTHNYIIMSSYTC